MEKFQHFADMEYIRSSVPGIMINENTFWVSGGYNMDFQEQDTTEFIFSNGTVEPGPKLPTAYSRHCKVINTWVKEI